MSTRTIPAPGNYVGALNGRMVIYEATTGSLCVAIPTRLVGAEVAWSGKHTETIATKDGELRTKVIANLKTIFGWDGLDPLTLEEIDGEANEIKFDLADCINERYIPEGETEERLTFKIGWMNPLGGNARMPEPIADRKGFTAKWGAKFRASAGTKPAAKPAAKSAAPAGKPAPAAPARAAAGGPPSRAKAPAAPAARQLTADEVWTLLVNANAGMGEKEMTAKFFAAQDELRANANSEFTPEEWGQIADALEV